MTERDGRGESLPRLVQIMRRLLGPDGCDWDRAQSLETLRPYVIEEAFEVVDAIDRREPMLLKEELGDLLMQIVFCAELARAAGHFGPDDVVAAIADKLERRHPHVFGDEAARARGAQQGDWERLKAQEKQGRGLLEGIPTALPALLRAVRVGEKAATVGYDWPDAAGVRAKIAEELAELDAAADHETEEREAEERELGDLLFAIASYARKRRLDPEAALRGALDRFAQRMAVVEEQARQEGVRLETLDAEELDVRWRAAKAKLDESQS
jgi:tetrapyrrole methylase family protein/MazG family protein/ATP diphosphatase